MSRDVVVVLHYRGLADTERCVESLVKGSPDAQVLVVDNGSEDGALDHLVRRWPALATLQNGENLGFAGGMNTGLRWALERSYSSITILNNDTVVPPGTVSMLSARAQRGIAVSPEVRYADGTDQVWFGGGVVDRATCLARHLTPAEQAAPDEDGLRATETLAGCCVTAAPHVWRQVGLFDERYFLNFEDSDWSLRAAGAGVPLAVDTTLHIYHRVSASFTGAYTYLGLYYYVRNGLLFGRDRCGGSWRNSLRFLRRHVLPGLRRTEQPAGRRMVVAATAVRDYGCGRFGRAPRWLEERAADWSGPRSRATKASRSGAGRR